jgi:hypothetical protein
MCASLDPNLLCIHVFHLLKFLCSISLNLLNRLALKKRYLKHSMGTDFDRIFQQKNLYLLPSSMGLLTLNLILDLIHGLLNRYYVNLQKSLLVLSCPSMNTVVYPSRGPYRSLER